MALSRIKLFSLNYKALFFISVKELHTATDFTLDFDLSASSSHSPVMVNEVIEHLNLKPGNLYLDMTFGAGGHCSALIEKVPELRVLALDRDPHAEKYMKELSEKYDNKILPLIGKFSDLPELLKKNNIGFSSVDGVLFDVGCSSMQLDNGDRGFSFTHNGPIDMRMDGNRIPGSISAAHLIEHATEVDLLRIFKIYGEERKAIKIARAIVQSRFNFQPLKTTKELADLVEAVCENKMFEKKRPTHSATKIFQALRIFVNNELNELHYGLMLAHKYLKPGGRAVALSFHSLEDKIVKSHFKNLIDYNDNYITSITTKTFDDSYVEPDNPKKNNWAVINKKAIAPTDIEIFINRRSRSAKLRAAAKV